MRLCNWPRRRTKWNRCAARTTGGSPLCVCQMPKVTSVRASEERRWVGSGWFGRWLAGWRSGNGCCCTHPWSRVASSRRWILFVELNRVAWSEVNNMAAARSAWLQHRECRRSPETRARPRAPSSAPDQVSTQVPSGRGPLRPPPPAAPSHRSEPTQQVRLSRGGPKGGSKGPRPLFVASRDIVLRGYRAPDLRRKLQLWRIPQRLRRNQQVARDSIVFLATRVRFAFYCPHLSFPQRQQCNLFSRRFFIVWQ